MEPDRFLNIIVDFPNSMVATPAEVLVTLWNGIIARAIDMIISRHFFLEMELQMLPGILCS